MLEVRATELRSVAFVGAGPKTIYTIHALLEHASPSFDLTIFEEQASVGRGTPYRPGWNDPAMLSNIASTEIPEIEETLVEWLDRQPADRLTALGYHERVAQRRDPERLSDRARRDQDFKPEAMRVFAENFSVYGVRKVWRQINRKGFTVAHCTIVLLMRYLGLQGVNCAIGGSRTRPIAPLGWEHISLTGDYSWNVEDRPDPDALRPLSAVSSLLAA